MAKYISLSKLKIFLSNLKEWINSNFVSKGITINGKSLNENITLTASDVGADSSGSASTALADAKTYTDKIANTKADIENGIYIVTTEGTGSAYTATVPNITALTAGVNFIMIPNVVSASTAPTLDVNGLGAKTLKRRLSNMATSLQAGYSNTWLAKGIPQLVTYNGTYWVVENHSKPSSADLYGTLSIEKGGTGATTAEDALTNLGLTATATELNYVDGVTSNVQTQLDNKSVVKIVRW